MVYSSTCPFSRLLPHDPIGRRGPDGRAYRVIPFNRHLIPFPWIAYPASSWKAACDPVDAFGHPEVLSTLHRIDCLLDQPRWLSEHDIHHLRMFATTLPIVFVPVREAIADRYPAGFLLPCFGNFMPLGAVQSAFRERGGRGEVHRSVGFLQYVTVALELLEARTRPSPMAADGNPRFDFRVGAFQ
jgi:hypothetical protein